MKFKEYCKKILKESPTRLGLSYGENLDNNAYNREACLDIIKTNKPIKKINYLSGVIYLYLVDNVLYAIDKKSKFISAYIIFREFESGIESLGIWNKFQYKGLVRFLFFNYFLKKYPKIVSDISHTTQGEKCWEKMVIDSLKSGFYSVFIYNEINKKLINIKTVNELKKYYGSDKYHYRIVISNEKNNI